VRDNGRVDAGESNAGESDTGESNPSDPAQQSWYDAFGGSAFFARLVSSFYGYVAQDPILRPMYPEGDLAPAERRLRMFLEQYWGGPTTYNDERGHPRLRMRHAAFPIDTQARDRWLLLMAHAVHEQGLEQRLEDELWTYLVGAAFAMQNIDDQDSPASALPLIEPPTARS